jgi:hypothetical protein
MLPSLPGYDSWKLASPDDYDQDEWTENYDDLRCEEVFEFDVEDTEHKCGLHCSPEQNFHVCTFMGKLEVSCVGDPEGDFTLYWECPVCGAEHQEEAK